MRLNCWFSFIAHDFITSRARLSPRRARMSGVTNSNSKCYYLLQAVTPPFPFNKASNKMRNEEKIITRKRSKHKEYKKDFNVAAEKRFYYAAKSSRDLTMWGVFSSAQLFFSRLGRKKLWTFYEVESKEWKKRTEGVGPRAYSDNTQDYFIFFYSKSLSGLSGCKMQTFL